MRYNHSFYKTINKLVYLMWSVPSIKYNSFNLETPKIKFIQRGSKKYNYNKYYGNRSSFSYLLKQQMNFRKFITNAYDMSYPSHPWHIVDKSPWPIIAGFSAFFFTFGLILFMHGFTYYQLPLGFGFILLTIYCWTKDIIREGTFLGKHTSFVQKSLKTGFIFFIISEFMLFFSFFWTLFNFYFIGSVETSFIYPPKGISMDIELPGIMNLILIISGLVLNLSHVHYNLKLNYLHMVSIKRYLMVTVFFGFLFIELQVYEYIHNSFTISDSTFGSIFYLLTGCHSLHVIVGVTYLLVAFIRIEKYHVTFDHNVNYDLAVWYWHFVDAIWIFLYFNVYYLFYYIEKDRANQYKNLMYEFGEGSPYFNYFHFLQQEYFNSLK